jgi:hypothetical protein
MFLLYNRFITYIKLDRYLLELEDIAILYPSLFYICKIIVEIYSHKITNILLVYLNLFFMSGVRRNRTYFT